MSAAVVLVFVLAVGAVVNEAVVQSGSSSSSEGHRSSMVDGSTSDLRPSIRVKPPRGRSSTSRSSDVSSHAAFAVRLYAVLASKDTESDDDVPDVAFSPLSVASLLYALVEGANGTTAHEIHAALNHTHGESNDGRRECHRWMEAAVDGLRSETSVSMATRVFHAPLFHLKPDYVARLQSRYRVKTQPLDFMASPDGAERAVNAWVADATRQHIQTLVPTGTFDRLTVLVFVNALFFKAEWQTKFDETRTRLRPFHVRRSSDNASTYERAVTTMHVVAEFPYRDFRRFRFEMIELPYTSSGCSMFVVLPHRGSSLSAVVGHLLRRPTIVAQPRRRLHNETVAVFLPRFRVDEASVDLKSALGGLGIVQAFQEGRADLSGIGGTGLDDGTDELHVSEALHKVFIEVDEKGSRASAASGLVIKGRSMSSDPVFRADRPFLYFIRHNPTSSILFMGNVAHPKDVVQVTSSTASPLLRTRVSHHAKGFRKPE